MRITFTLESIEFSRCFLCVDSWQPSDKDKVVKVSLLKFTQAGGLEIPKTGRLSGWTPGRLELALDSELALGFEIGERYTMAEILTRVNDQAPA